jgi:hypothetical protein
VEIPGVKLLKTRPTIKCTSKSSCNDPLTNKLLLVESKTT